MNEYEQQLSALAEKAIAANFDRELIGKTIARFSCGYEPVGGTRVWRTLLHFTDGTAAVVGWTDEDAAAQGATLKLDRAKEHHVHQNN